VHENNLLVTIYMGIYIMPLIIKIYNIVYKDILDTITKYNLFLNGQKHFHKETPDGITISIIYTSNQKNKKIVFIHKRYAKC